MIENPEQRARRRACAVIAHAMSGPLADPWLLQEDGEYDLGAVRVATEGTRRVRLTLTERIAAATAILLRAGTARQVCEHLSLPRVVRG